jgi:AraC family transcriptional regulator
MTTTTHLDSMEVTVPSVVAAQLDATARSDPAEISAAMGATFRKVNAFLAMNRLTPSGPPRAIYTTWGPTEVGFTVAIPIAAAPPTVEEADGVRIEKLPERTALRFVHHGPYRHLQSTYGRIEAWLRERGGIETPGDWSRYSPMWEEYLNDPGSTPESELVTRIYLTLP